MMKNRLLMAIAISASIGLQSSSLAESRFIPIESQSAKRLLLSKQSNLVDFPEVGLALPQPSGFTKATSFYGFEQADTSSSVMLSKIPGPFAAVTKGFNKSTLATRGIELISKQSVKIDNQQGLLLNVAQSAYGQKFLKWILVFGNDKETNVITATFPVESASQSSENLKKIILAVEPSSIATPTASSLPFTVTGVEGLARVAKATAFGKAALFTKDGNMPGAAITDPVMIVAPSLGAVPVGDRKSFAQKRLYVYPQIEVEKVTATKETEIDTLPGWEITADGRDPKTKVALKIYQTILFPKAGGYVLIMGVVGSKQSELYLPKFKAIAQTYRNLSK